MRLNINVDNILTIVNIIIIYLRIFYGKNLLICIINYLFMEVFF